MTLGAFGFEASASSKLLIGADNELRIQAEQKKIRVVMHKTQIRAPIPAQAAVVWPKAFQAPRIGSYES